MKINLDPVDNDIELYKREIEYHRKNLINYENQFGKNFHFQSMIEYAAEQIAFARSEVRYWKSMVMEEVMENRRKRNVTLTEGTSKNQIFNSNPPPKPDSPPALNPERNMK